MPCRALTRRSRTARYALLGPLRLRQDHSLLNIVSGLIQPSEGRVLFGQTDVTDLSNT